MSSDAARSRVLTLPGKAVDNIPPHDIDAEMAVLSAILMDPGALHIVQPVLHADDFSSVQHRRVFRAMVAMAERGVAIDPLTLSDALGRSNELEASGGKDYISVLVDAVPSSANAAYYAEIVVRYAQQRAVIEELERGITAAKTGAASPVEIAAELEQALARFSAAAAPRRFQFVDDETICHLPPSRDLIAGLIPEQSTGLLYGAPGSAKSFLALAWALHVAAGVSWSDRAVRRALTVYVYGEGASGIGARVDAWKHSQGITGRVGCQLLPEAVQLLDRGQVDAFIREVQTFREAPGLIVFDTLHRCSAGADENAARDMGLVIEASDRIRKETGAAVLFVHHPAKGGEAERGSGAIAAAMDVKIRVARVGMEVTLTSEKTKDAEPFGPISLSLRPAARSCVLVTPTSRAGVSPKTLTPNALVALASLHELMRVAPPPRRSGRSPQSSRNRASTKRALS